MKRLTNNEFKEHASIIHNNFYNYDLSNYKNNRTKVKIICHKHGIFEQRPNDHLKGQGCPYCANNVKLSVDEIKKRADIIHNNKYEYSLFTEYNTQQDKIIIICPIHGKIIQKINNHLNGKGCKFCAKNVKKTNDEFIIDANIIHNNVYDYSLVDYKTAHDLVKIICKKHGIFQVTPNTHLNTKSGCPMCNNSKGEMKIIKILNELKIRFEKEKKFDNCKHKQKLPFDFYLPEHNICIEYDGIQHFEPIKIFGGEEKLKIRQIRDQIKNEYCLNNNIRLIRIKYNENIEEILNNLL